MPLSTTPGADYTWTTAAWSWDDVRAGKTWDTAYPAVYVEDDPETLTASEARASLAAVARAEGFALAEAQAKQATAARSEALALAELQQDVIGFVRAISEAFSLAELGARIGMKAAAEALAIAEVRSASVVHPSAEAVAVSEATVRLIAAYRLEQLQLLDASTELIDFVRNAQEALTVAEVRLVVMAKALAEAVAVADQASRAAAFSRQSAESFALAEARRSQLLQAFGELILPVEADASLVAFSRNGEESIAVAENYIDLIGFIVNAQETLGVSEATDRSLLKPVAEALGITEAQARLVSKALAEALAASDAYVDLIGFINAVAEGISIGEARKSTMTHRSVETVAVLDRLVRRINAVVADLAIRSGGMTAEQFAEMQRLKKPLGNYQPKPLQPGDYRYRRALISLTLEDIARTSREVAIDVAKLTVDVPDVTDRGTATLTTSGATVAFERSFYDPPEVQVIQTGGSTRAIPAIGTITASGFFVQLFDASLPTVPVAGSISWTALGK